MLLPSKHPGLFILDNQDQHPVLEALCSLHKEVLNFESLVDEHSLRDITSPLCQERDAPCCTPGHTNKHCASIKRLYVGGVIRADREGPGSARPSAERPRSKTEQGTTGESPENRCMSLA